MSLSSYLQKDVVKVMELVEVTEVMRCPLVCCYISLQVQVPPAALIESLLLL